MLIQNLKIQLKIILPLLMKHREYAEKQLKKKKLQQETYNYIEYRTNLARYVIAKPELNQVEYMEKCSAITLDLRSAVKEYPKEKQKLISWLNFYKEAGYTELKAECPIYPK